MIYTFIRITESSSFLLNWRVRKITNHQLFLRILNTLILFLLCWLFSFNWNRICPFILSFWFHPRSKGIFLTRILVIFCCLWLSSSYSFRSAGAWTSSSRKSCENIWSFLLSLKRIILLHFYLYKVFIINRNLN